MALVKTSKIAALAAKTPPRPAAAKPVTRRSPVRKGFPGQRSARKNSQPIGDRALGAIEAAEEDAVAPFDQIGDHLSGIELKPPRTLPVNDCTRIYCSNH
jgi:hypothetical protein